MAFELTKEFVQKLVGQPITSFEVKAGSNEGDNVQGVLKAIKVTTTEADTLNLVHKTIVPDPMMKAFIVEGQTFRIENTFYTTIAPAIEKLIKSHTPEDYKLPIPKLYAAFNNDCDDYTTMEDLRPSGFKMLNKYKGLSLPEVSLLLHQLGRFHAFTYYFIKYEGEQFFDTVSPRIKKLAFLEPEKKEEMQLMQREAANIAIDLISKRNPELGKKVEAVLRAPGASDAQMHTTLSTDKKYFPVIIHGDMWVNNIMFKYDVNGKPTDVKFIDFQLVRRGNIFEELQYFFLTSTTPEFRRRHLHQSLEIYYRSFTSTLKGIGCPVPSDFTLGFLVDNLYKAFFCQFHFMAFVIALQLGEKPQAPNPPEQVGHLEAPAAPSTATSEQQPPPAFNLNDIPVEIRIGGFMAQVRAQLEGTPRAIDRLVEITEEMASLGLI